MNIAAHWNEINPNFREDDASADSEGTDTLKKPARQSPAYSNVEMEKSLSRREKNR